VVVDGHKEMWAINSQNFKRFLAGQHFMKVGEAAAKEGLTNLIMALEGKGNYRGINHDLKSDGDKLLFRVYLVSLFIPDIPHVILVLYGDQGSAKTTLFKLIKSLVDPSKTDVLTFSKNTQEMVQKLDHHWFCDFDNVSDLPDWLSDMLCRASTWQALTPTSLTEASY
jgi:hypothetical protein